MDTKAKIAREIHSRYDSIEKVAEWLFSRLQPLKAENKQLKKENARLKAQLARANAKS